MKVPRFIDGEDGERPLTDARPFIPPTEARSPRVALRVLADAANRCRGCDLHRGATQAVFGTGPVHADIMLVGEQPGDEEDTAGHPFVGPAGGALDAALLAAGIERRRCYITNVVKHFKWTPAPRGKRRLHARPNASEVRACMPWFERELALVGPQVVVLLGATAAHSVFGPAFRVTRERGKVIRSSPIAPAVVATIHPSAILRAPDEATASALHAALVHDLRLAKSAVAGHPGSS